MVSKAHLEEIILLYLSPNDYQDHQLTDEQIIAYMDMMTIAPHVHNYFGHGYDQVCKMLRLTFEEGDLWDLFGPNGHGRAIFYLDHDSRVVIWSDDQERTGVWIPQNIPHKEPGLFFPCLTKSLEALLLTKTGLDTHLYHQRESETISFPSELIESLKTTSTELEIPLDQILPYI